MKDGDWYTGWAKDLRERFKQHSEGKVFSTKNRGPFKIIYYEACENELDARQRERYLKSGPGKRYLKNRMKRSLSLTGHSPAKPKTPGVRTGFSLMEVILILAIVGFIAVFGVIVGTDSLLRQNRRAHVDIVSGYLEKARSLAINNVESSAYGVYFADPDYVLLFKGGVYGGSYVYRTEKNELVSYDLSGCLSEEVSFEQLSGRSAECHVKVNDITITINNEGGINY